MWSLSDRWPSSRFATQSCVWEKSLRLNKPKFQKLAGSLVGFSGCVFIDEVFLSLFCSPPVLQLKFIYLAKSTKMSIITLATVSAVMFVLVCSGIFFPFSSDFANPRPKRIFLQVRNAFDASEGVSMQLLTKDVVNEWNSASLWSCWLMMLCVATEMDQR